MSWTLIIIADGTRSMVTIPGFQSEDAARAAGSKAVEEEVSFARYRVVEVPDPVIPKESVTVRKSNNSFTVTPGVDIEPLGSRDRDLGEVPL